MVLASSQAATLLLYQTKKKVNSAPFSHGDGAGGTHIFTWHKHVHCPGLAMFASSRVLLAAPLVPIASQDVYLLQRGCPPRSFGQLRYRSDFGVSLSGWEDLVDHRAQMLKVTCVKLR